MARTATVAIMAAALVTSACGRNEAALAASAEKNGQAAVAFLIKNASEPGVVSLPSGLQYRVVASGPAGGVRPDRNDLVRVDYEGSLLDGTVFDSSFAKGQPFVTAPSDVVKGWTEALQLMRPGDEWMLYLPPALGYGDVPTGEIPPGSALVFRVKMLDVAVVPGGGRGVGSAMG